MTDGRQTTAQAFDAFAEKFQRFIAAGGDEPTNVAKPAPSQEALNVALREQQKAVITRYKGFVTPDAAVARDEAELLAAYRLFKAVQQADAEHTTEQTHLESFVIASPLVHADRYTIGGDFIYLQCWLAHEKGCKDYVPELQPQPTGADSYRLVFVPARHHHITYNDKEKQDIIRNCFYSTER